MVGHITEEVTCGCAIELAAALIQLEAVELSSATRWAQVQPDPR